MSTISTWQANLWAENMGEHALPKPRRLVLEDAAGHVAMSASGTPVPIAGSLKEAAGVAIVFYDKSRVTPECS